MNKESCKITLTFLDWQEQSPNVFIKTLSNTTYCIKLYTQQIVKRYNLIGYLVVINTQKEDRYFNTYNEIIEFIKTFQ